MCRSPAALATLYGLEGLIGSVSAAEPPRGEVAVDLVGRDLDEARAGAAHLLEQHLRAEELGPPEVGRAEDRAVDVGLGGEVDDRVAAVGCLGDRGRVADVARDELDPGAVEVRRVARVGQLVEHAHVVARGLEPLGEVGADEAGPAGDEHAHRVEGYVTARSRAPSRSASPCPPWCMTTLWFQRKTGRAIGASRFIHGRVVCTFHS